MTLPLTNLLSDLPKKSDEEFFTTLFQNPNCRIERIVSYGQCSPEDFWYDQTWDEWVLLLQGSAELNIEGQTVKLIPGDHCLIHARQKHRVTHTDQNLPTIWLAVHFDNESRH